MIAPVSPSSSRSCPPRPTRRLTGILIVVAATLATGCASRHPSAVRQQIKLNAELKQAGVADLIDSQPVEAVQALCAVPAGWKAEPLKASSQHQHQIWMSPSGRTAYGVIHFSLPLPVGPDIVLPFYLKAMKKSEGEAHLRHKERDPELPGIRFVAEGGRYKIYTNLITDGFEGWAVYAGTLRDREINPAELDLAERARDHTRVGLPATAVAEVN